MLKRLQTLVLSIGLAMALFGVPSLASASSGDIIVQTIPGPTLAQQVTHRTSSSWSWYLTRASGMIAAIALVLLMLSGIGQVTGYTFRLLEPLTAWASHRALGLTFGVALLVHMVTLLFDHFVPFNIVSLLVPWVSVYKPLTIGSLHLGSVYVALGVLAFYGTLGIIMTSLLWIDKKPYVWKIVHLGSYGVIAAVFFHALYLGTDLATGWIRWLWIGLAIAIAASVLHRLWRAKTI